jgi:hypothetical protein
VDTGSDEVDANRAVDVFGMIRNDTGRTLRHGDGSRGEFGGGDFQTSIGPLCRHLLRITKERVKGHTVIVRRGSTGSFMVVRGPRLMMKLQRRAAIDADRCPARPTKSAKFFGGS